MLRQSSPVLLPTTLSVELGPPPGYTSSSYSIRTSSREEAQGSSGPTSLATAATVASTRLKARLPGGYFWCELLRTPYRRSSQNPPLTNFGEYPHSVPKTVVFGTHLYTLFRTYAPD